MDSAEWPRVYIWWWECGVELREEVARVKDVKAAMAARDYYRAKGYGALVMIRGEGPRTWKELRESNAEEVRNS